MNDYSKVCTHDDEMDCYCMNCIYFVANLGCVYQELLLLDELEKNNILQLSYQTLPGRNGVEL